VQVCPVACIPVNPQRVEGRDALLAKFRVLQAQAGVNPTPDSAA